ncbi:glutathione S-transferase family protein [Ningiella sp. W23]|uniref:glutathione S-transferase family protein n=1 Tax=Ningiella sp. W23 TaxID=3023715 RepID=UPI0037578708
MLTVLSYPGTRGVRITWACEELGLDYEYQLVNLYKNEHKQPEFLKVTPMAKVPALIDGDLSLAESGAIVSYLADKAGRLIPNAGTPERGLYEQAMYFTLTELEQPLWTIAKHKFVYPEQQRIEKMQALGALEFESALKIFSKLLGDKPFILGDDFSVADVVAGHTLSWAQGFKLSLVHNNVEKYAKNVLARDALARARKREEDAKEKLDA